MDKSKINVRYARALFLTGKEQNQIEILYDDVVRISNLCRHSVDFTKLLDNPVINVSKKKIILRELLQSHVCDLTLRFVLLVTDHQREGEIPGICRNFISLVKTDRGIVSATVTAARDLSEDMLSKIRLELEQETGKIVELTGKTEPALIGGMIVRIEDLQYDGSIAAQLKKIKAEIGGGS